MTEKHYAQPSAVSNSKTARVASTLVPTGSELEERGRSLAEKELSPTERAQLLALLSQESSKTQTRTDLNTARARSVTVPKG